MFGVYQLEGLERELNGQLAGIEGEEVDEVRRSMGILQVLRRDLAEMKRNLREIERKVVELEELSR